MQIIAIGNGTALMAQDFAEQFSIQYPLYTDPKRLSYQYFKMEHKIGIGFSTLILGFKAFRKGFRQSGVFGDPKQQGGVVLVDQEGKVYWSHIDSGAGTHAELDVIQKQVLLLLESH